MPFDELRALLARRIGVCLRDDQAGSLERLVEARMSQLGLQSGGEYVTRLQAEPLEGDEFALLIATITNPHTYFFRDLDQFSVLRRAAAVWRREQSEPLYIWSAGCASGEEPYSAAMICADLGVDAMVLATDINREALAFARKGRYLPWSMRQLPSSFVDRYFMPDGTAFVIRPEIRAMVSFEFHNLMTQTFPRPLRTGLSRSRLWWDWILCRNVFIYFERRTIDEVSARLAAALDDDGSLMLSATETLSPQATGLRLVRAGRSFLYRWPRSDSSDLGADFDEQVLPPAGDWPLMSFTRPSPTQAPPAELRWPPSVLPPAPTAATESRLDDPEPGPGPGPGDALDPASAALVLIDDGNAHLCAHRFEQALTAYDRAHQLAPLLPEVHYLQGLVYRKLGDLERSLQAFRRALFLEPGFWCAAYMLAGIYDRLGLEQRRRAMLRHTLAWIGQFQIEQLFTSSVRGLPNLDLNAFEVEAACRRELASASACYRGSGPCR